MAPMIVGRWLRTLVVVLQMMLVLAVAPAFGAGGIRTWRDESGKFEIRAELLDFDGRGCSPSFFSPRSVRLS